MRKIIMLLSFFILSSCIQEDPRKTEEKEPVESENEPFKNICELDMGAAEGEFELKGKWEFVGFENLKIGRAHV